MKSINVKYLALQMAISGLMLFGQAKVEAASQSPVLIEATDEYRIAISAPSDSSRVGNAVLLRVYYFNFKAKNGYVTRVLASCDGKWVSTDFSQVLQPFDSMTLLEQQQHALIMEDKVELGTSSLSMIKVADAAGSVESVIASKMPNYCKRSGKELRNFYIPIARGTEVDGVMKVAYLATGTSEKLKDTIDVWFQFVEYELVPMRRLDGAPAIGEGSIIKIPKPTGNRELERSTYDCARRRSGLSQQVIYRPGKVEPAVIAHPRESLKLSVVMPNTLGETTLDWVCAIYGARSN